MSEALDTVRDERANGRMSPALAELLDELDERVRALEAPAYVPPVENDETPNGGE